MGIDVRCPQKTRKINYKNIKISFHLLPRNRLHPHFDYDFATSLKMFRINFFILKVFIFKKLKIRVGSLLVRCNLVIGYMDIVEIPKVFDQKSDPSIFILIKFQLKPNKYTLMNY